MADLLYLMGFFTDEAPLLGSAPALDMEKNLHVTVLPTFSLHDLSLELLAQSLAEVVKPFPPIIVTPCGTAAFGEHAEVPVTLLDGTSGAPYSLNELHRRAGISLNSLGGFFTDQYVGKKYTPHVSHWLGQEVVTVSHLSLFWHSAGFGKEVQNLANYELNAIE